MSLKQRKEMALQKAMVAGIPDKEIPDKEIPDKEVPDKRVRFDEEPDEIVSSR